MEDEADDDVARNHVSKRSRYNKNTVVVFDNADRVEFLSGFRKRKEKRRQAGEQQKQHKERQKRIQDRRERRAALKEAKGATEVPEDGAQTDGEDEFAEASTKDVSGTATYEDKETTTVVRVTTLTAEDEDQDQETDEQPVRKADHHTAISQKLKPAKVKFKKPKKVKSEKRMRKLTRREKAMPKNLRSRRDKKRKK
ncbi:unnamed protein product [Calypogeia fissa]